MATVKYSGPIASFRCPTNADIRSLKVHFSPKQEGTGDPSPENVREIVGWDGVEVYHTGKNLCPAATSTEMYENWEFYSSGKNYVINGLPPEQAMTLQCNLLEDRGQNISNLRLYLHGSDYGFINTATPSGLKSLTRHVASDGTIRISHNNIGLSPTSYNVQFNNVQLEIGSTATPYEPYHSSTIDYEFGVLGKNKFNWDVPVSESSPVASDAATARKFTLDTYVIGMAVNNYYRRNYINWVLNPSVENGVISFGSSGASGYGIAFPLKLAVGQTYFLSGTGNGSVGATYYDENGELISYQNGRLNNTITVPENTVTTLIGFYASAVNTNFEFSNIQLELGSTATEYEPYDPNHTVYGGWVDLISGEVCDNWWKDSWNLGADEGTIKADGTRRIAKNIASAHQCDTDFREKGVCDELLYFQSNSDPRPRFFMSKVTAYMNLPNDNLPHTITIWYPSVSVTATYHLAPTQLQTFLGQNNVWSNADYVEVEYDLHETQDILKRKQFIIANQPHIEQISDTLAHFKTDISAPLKECKVYFNPIQDLHGYDHPWIGGTWKNLFNINAVEQNPDDMTAANTTARNFTAGTYCVGTSWSNWLQPHQVLEHSVSNGILSIKNNNVYGIGYALKVEPETNYAISATSSGGGIHAAFYDASGNFISGLSTNLLNTSFATPVDAAIAVLTFYNRSEGSDAAAATFSNIQFEKGSTATSYEPYENICPISGWTEIDVTRSGKNLFNIEEIVSSTSTYANGVVEDTLNHFVIKTNNDPIYLPDNNGNLFISVKAYNKVPATNVSSTRGLSIGLVYENNTFSTPTELRFDNSIITATTKTYITPANKKVISIYFDYGGGGNAVWAISDFIVTQNINEENEYEPYTGATIPITFPSEAGTIYGGYVDLITGEVWKTWSVATSSDIAYFMGRGTASLFQSGKALRCYCPNGCIKNGNWTVPCTHFTDVGPVGNWGMDVANKDGYVVEAAGNNIMFIASDLGFTTTQEWIQWVTDNNVQYAYPLQSPELVGTISTATLKTIKGINNIWSDANGPIEVKYWTH